MLLNLYISFFILCHFVEIDRVLTVMGDVASYVTYRLLHFMLFHSNKILCYCTVQFIISERISKFW